MIKRYLAEQIQKDLEKKMVFLGGPRQVGKTTLAQSLGPLESYLNWDDSEDRERILRKELPKTKLWIFDEIHKYKQWRNYLKGLYDKNKVTKNILVTGSARLDLYRRGGDSLQGRYHFLRLHPLSLDELHSQKQSDLAALFDLGGFPEPFFSSSEIDSKRWSREYRQRVLQEDILSVERIDDIGLAELLMMRLPDLVGSPLSINSLREDLQVSHKTVTRLLEIFERFYAIFRLGAFGSPKIKSVKKEMKHYHYDWTLLKDSSAKFENLIACHLLKWCQFYEDSQGRDIQLCFFRDKEQREVDFVVVEDKKPICFIEAKLSDKKISSSLYYLKKKFPMVPAFQLLYETTHDFQSDIGVRVAPAHAALSEIKLIIAGI